MTNTFDLSGKVALISGGSRGIGLGMAWGLAKAGATVMLVGRDGRTAEESANALRAKKCSADFLTADVAQEDSVKKMVATTVERHGRLDILINNAGTACRKRPEEHSSEDWYRIIDTNLSSAFWACSAAYPHLKAGGEGRIINIGSHASIFGATYTAAYAPSKGGLLMLTKSLAVAWAKDRICVNCILPGYIDTDLTREARRQVPGLNEKVLERTPLARWGTLEDCEGIAVFYASAAAAFITGTSLLLDGGYAAQG